MLRAARRKCGSCGAQGVCAAEKKGQRGRRPIRAAQEKARRFGRRDMRGARRRRRTGRYRGGCAWWEFRAWVASESASHCNPEWRFAGRCVGKFARAVVGSADGGDDDREFKYV